jgi:hypothetical protein
LLQTTPTLSGVQWLLSHVEGMPSFRSNSGGFIAREGVVYSNIEDPITLRRKSMVKVSIMLLVAFGRPWYGR